MLARILQRHRLGYRSNAAKLFDHCIQADIGFAMSHYISELEGNVSQKSELGSIGQVEECCLSVEISSL